MVFTSLPYSAKEDVLQEVLESRRGDTVEKIREWLFRSRMLGATPRGREGLATEDHRKTTWKRQEHEQKLRKIYLNSSY